MVNVCSMPVNRSRYKVTQSQNRDIRFGGELWRDSE